MACLCETDADAVMTSAMKLKLAAAAVLQKFERTVRSPLFRLSVSIVLVALGSRKNLPMLSALGWFFQWLNIHQIILYGGRHIEVARKLEKLCSELLIHFNAAQFQELKDLIAFHARYAQILDQSDGIKQLFETLKKEIRGDQIVRLYRLIAAFSALRLAIRACPFL
jgi:NAD-specific glutamate dehydrogenase